MRHPILLPALALLLLAPAPAHAIWCGSYRGGGTNCGFFTHAQCLAAISGLGGSCIEHPDPPRRPAAQERPRRKADPEKRAKPARQTPKATARPASATPAPNVGFSGARDLVLDGQYEAGLAALRALKFDDHPDVAAFIGLANRKLGRTEEARRWYERALASDPQHRIALSFYGILRAETGDIAGARDYLARVKASCGGADCNEYKVLDAVLTAQAR